MKRELVFYVMGKQVSKKEFIKNFDNALELIEEAEKTPAWTTIYTDSLAIGEIHVY